MFKNFGMEEYYEAMTENLAELEEIFEESYPIDRIEAYIARMTLKTYDHKSELNLPLYRARYDDGFNNTDPNQFGYIHNLDLITMFRYNKAHEAVLYTATDPMTAFKEIKQEGKPDNFYLSVWMPVNEECVLNMALNINGTGLKEDSNAWRFHQILRDNTGAGSLEYRYLSELGRLLEKPGSDYRCSSILASQIFQTHDALMTTSMKSEGKELNVTFNQYAADHLLEIKYVYHCRVPQNLDSLALDVTEVGIPHGGQIEWHPWEVDYGSIQLSPDCINPVYLPNLRDAVRTERGISQCVMKPNVNKAPTAEQDGVVVYNGELYHVRFRIRLG